MTDGRGGLGHHWQAVPGRQDGRLDVSRGWSRVAMDDRPRDLVLAISIEADYSTIVERINGCLAEAARTCGSPVRGGGALPLVCLPEVGIGHGGFDDPRGQVLRTLVAFLVEAAPRHGDDVALVTPEPSVHAAAQHARSAVPTRLPDSLEEHARRLGGLARAGRLG